MVGEHSLEIPFLSLFSLNFGHRPLTMDRLDVAYLVNSTPKYYYLLDLHFTLLTRYAPELRWPIFLATEVPEHPLLQSLTAKFPWVNLLKIPTDQSMFLESRLAATENLPPDISYVLPIQEDFLLEARPIAAVLKEAISLLEESPSLSSLRLMPCPGPASSQTWGTTRWHMLDFAKDSYVFTYQATIWRRHDYTKFLRTLLHRIRETRGTSLTPQQQVQIQIKENIAEVYEGQQILKQVTGLHLAWPREGKQPNAVYLSPWPYRPTAVVRGSLEPWARDLAEREGLPLAPSS